jgi:hypothetical protein
LAAFEDFARQRDTCAADGDTGAIDELVDVTDGSAAEWRATPMSWVLDTENPLAVAAGAAIHPGTLPR